MTTEFIYDNLNKFISSHRDRILRLWLVYCDMRAERMKVVGSAYTERTCLFLIVFIALTYSSATALVNATVHVMSSDLNPVDTRTWVWMHGRRERTTAMIEAADYCNLGNHSPSTKPLTIGDRQLGEAAPSKNVLFATYPPKRN